MLTQFRMVSRPFSLRIAASLSYRTRGPSEFDFSITLYSWLKISRLTLAGLRACLRIKVRYVSSTLTPRDLS